jgi:hypothetical protein
MRKWILGCAVVTLGCFLIEPAQGQETIKAPQTTVITSSPTTSSPRVGLFRRLRDRRQGTTTISQPMVTTRGVSSSSSTTPSQSGIVQAQATVPSTTTTTQPVTTAQMQTTETRQGLLSRLRGRLGR